MQNGKTLWYNYSAEDCLSKLQSNKTGITEEEARKRQQEYGLNELPTGKRFSGLKIFLNQFNNSMIFILLIAAGLSLFLGEMLDLMVILGAIFINVIVGYIQEAKAEKALAKLKKIVVQKSKIIRDGQVRIIESIELVPGDIIVLEAGDQIAADARLIEAKNIHTKEAILTGESSPVMKELSALTEEKEKKVLVGEQNNMVFKGTLVTEGKGLAVVTATGIETEMGKIASMIKETEQGLTPLQVRLADFSKKLGIAVLFIAFVIVILGVLKGVAFQSIIMVAVAVAVAAIPEGLIISITVTLVVGIQRILKQKALVRKLVAAETLGSTNIVCVDKTGTLTEGVMRVSKIFILPKEWDVQNHNLDGDQDLDQLIKYTMLCNNAVVENMDEPKEKWKFIGSPTEKAIVELLRHYKFDLDELHTKYPRLDEVPFDSYNKRMVTFHKQDEENQLVIQKGAPEKIISYCHYRLKDGEVVQLTESDKKEIYRQMEDLSRSGHRLLASCYKTEKLSNDDVDIDENFVFLGFMAINDPIRKSVKKTLRLAKAAGLRTIMITGDYALTAKAIAQELGMKVKDKNVLTGAEMDEMTDEDFEARIDEIDVYARVTPAHKLKIVKTWQKLDQIVAMTGDGVNDAPALKAADIGVSVGSGTDVTKATADMVLLDNNFSVIIEAIKQGRLIFINIKKIIVYLLTDAFSSVVLVFGSLLMGLPIPITAAQILWINMLTDGFPAAALTIEKSYDDVMKDKPRSKKAPVLDNEMKVLIFIIGVFVDFILLSLFYYLYTSGLFSIEYIRTLIFTSLGIDTLLYVFSCKSLRHSIFTINPFDNKYLNVAVVFGAMMIITALYVPFFRDLFHFEFLGQQEWIIVIALGLIKITLIEFTKYIFTSYKDKDKRIWNY